MTEHLCDRGWHGRGFSNLSRLTPIKKISTRPNPMKKLGENTVPFQSWKKDSHSLPLPFCVFIYMFFRNLSVALKKQHRSQRAHLSWIEIQNVVFLLLYWTESQLKQCATHTHYMLCKSSMLTHTFSRLFDFFHLKVDISLSIDIFLIDGVSKFLAQVHRDRRQKHILFGLITL